MPTSATGTSTRRTTRAGPIGPRGFSLLELLVVVAIIGIFLSVAVLSTDLVSFERKLEREAERLAMRVRFTSEEALMQSRDFGIVFYDEGYEFLMFEPGQGWLETGGAGMEDFRLEPDMDMRLTINEREVVMDERCELFDCSPGAAATGDEDDDAQPDSEADDGPGIPTPQVVIYSSGEVTPFELEVRRESRFTEPGYFLTVEFDGESEIARGDV